MKSSMRRAVIYNVYAHGKLERMEEVHCLGAQPFTCFESARVNSIIKPPYDQRRQDGRLSEQPDALAD